MGRLGAENCPHVKIRTPDQAGLRITSFAGIKVVSEPGFGAKEPPLGTPEHLVAACFVVPALGTSLTKWV